MQKPVDFVSTLINLELEKVQSSGPVSYMVEKVNERNPLKPSVDYQKQVRQLNKRAKYLKAMKRQFSKKAKSDQIAATITSQLEKRLFEIHSRLAYLKVQENAHALLKCSSPCNLLIPGSGNAVRTLAYGIKFVNVAHFHLFQPNKLEEMLRVIKEISLASSVSYSSQFFYDKIRSLKDYLTYPSFRSLVYY